jgi:glycosyltransferase involved in cell wall biosynthesis
MRLGINGFFWNRQATGSGQYTHQLVRGLSERPDGPQCLLFRPENSQHQLESPQPAENVEQYPLRPPFTPTRNLSKVWFEQISFPRGCHGERVDLRHVPYFASPLMGGDKTIVTIHDLIPLILPAYRGSPLVRVYTRLVSVGAKRAVAIVTDSEYSRQDILRLLGVEEARTHVVYLAAQERFEPIRDDSVLTEVRKKYGLPQEYILYLGGFDQRKNLGTLLAAYSAMDANLVKDAPLVIAGIPPQLDSDFFPDPRRIADEHDLQDRVTFAGWVAEEDKPALYSSAVLFVFPSLYEGFGLPVLEAMSCGTAALVSDAASLPEIVGQAAMLFDPHNTEELAEAMSVLLRDKARRAELAARGLERAQLFSWDKTISQTQQVYRSVTGGAQSLGDKP